MTRIMANGPYAALPIGMTAAAAREARLKRHERARKIIVIERVNPDGKDLFASLC